jgi:hypothetical protein
MVFLILAPVNKSAKFGLKNKKKLFFIYFKKKHKSIQINIQTVQILYKNKKHVSNVKHYSNTVKK